MSTLPPLPPPDETPPPDPIRAAEAALLGSALLLRSAEPVQGLPPDSFSDKRLALVARAITHLAATGCEPDTVGVYHALSSHPESSDWLGTASLLARCLDSVVVALSWRAARGVVEEASLRRRLAGAVTRLGQGLEAGRPWPQLRELLAAAVDAGEAA